MYFDSQIKELVFNSFYLTTEYNLKVRKKS